MRGTKRNYIKGWLSNYCGYGGEGPTEHEIDEGCEEHDEDYQEMIEHGEDPYNGGINWADKKFFKRIENLPYHIKLKHLPLYIGIKAFKLYKSQQSTNPSNMSTPSIRKSGKRKKPANENAGKASQVRRIGSHQSDMVRTRSQTAEEAPQRHQHDPVEHPGNVHGDRAHGSIQGGEQQVSVPKHIWRRFPNTENAALKWILTQYIGTGATAPPTEPFDEANEATGTSLLTTAGGALSNPAFNTITTQARGYDFISPCLIQLRMTSPYNILKNFGSPSTANSQPAWLELFDSKYTYYHVIECEWEAHFTFGVPNNGVSANQTNFQGIGYYIFWRYTANDDPPTQYTCSTTSIANAPSGVTTSGNSNDYISVQQMANSLGTQNCSPDDYFRMGGWKHKHVMLNTTHPTKVILNGHYKFGQCKMDIKTMDAVTPSGSTVATTTSEGWNQVGAQAAFPENLSIIIVQDNATYAAAGVTTPCSVRMETEHLIQFKDLRKNYKFPTPALSQIPSSGTYPFITTDTQYFSRGAAYT